MDHWPIRACNNPHKETVRSCQRYKRPVQVADMKCRFEHDPEF